MLDNYTGVARPGSTRGFSLPSEVQQDWHGSIRNQTKNQRSTSPVLISTNVCMHAAPIDKPFLTYKIYTPLSSDEIY